MSENEFPQAFQTDAALDARRKALGDKIQEERAEIIGQDKAHLSAQADAQGLGNIFKLSSEFVGGVFAGGLLGWTIDHYAGSKPWGLIVCTLLGFAAGILNMMRAVGLTKSWNEKLK